MDVMRREMASAVTRFRSDGGQLLMTSSRYSRNRSSASAGVSKIVVVTIHLSTRIPAPAHILLDLADKARAKGDA